VGVEAFSLHHALADETKTSLATVLAGRLLSGKLNSRGRRKEPDSAIGEHAIHIEQQQLDLAGTFQGHNGNDNKGAPCPLAIAVEE